VYDRRRRDERRDERMREEGRESERGKSDSRFCFSAVQGFANGKSELGHSNADLLMQVKKTGWSWREEEAEAFLMVT
jgi:hypothetical protein